MPKEAKQNTEGLVPHKQAYEIVSTLHNVSWATVADATKILFAGKNPHLRFTTNGDNKNRHLTVEDVRVIDAAYTYQSKRPFTGIHTKEQRARFDEMINEAKEGMGIKT